MWKTDNNSELNKLYKDIKINKYYTSDNFVDEKEASETEKRIINDLKEFIFEVVLIHFEKNDTIGALYHFNGEDGEAISNRFYDFLTLTCKKFEYGFIDTSIKDTQIEYLYMKELYKDPDVFCRIVTKNDTFKKYYRIRMPFEHKE